MSKLPKRTAKDEYKYDQFLRSQEDIKSELIKSLKCENAQLQINQAKLLENLIEYSYQIKQLHSDLEIYRGQLLRTTQSKLSNGGIPSNFQWNSTNGWSKK